MTGDAQRDERLEARFWNELEASPFLMLGLQGVDDAHTRPMTAQLDGREIWFFARQSEELVKGLGQGARAIATFASKGHEIFACIHGRLSISQDRNQVDRLWSPSVASWYPGGKDDPELTLVRFEAESAHIWEAETGAAFKAAVVKLFGGDPQKAADARDRAEVTL